MLPLHRTSTLVHRPVTYRDIRLGVATDALFDRAVRRLVGLDVRCGDGADRLLPFPACEVREGRLAVESALVLLEGNVDFYRLEGSTFGALQGVSVLAGGVELGTLADLVVDDHGEVARVVVAATDGDVELEPHEATVGAEGLRPAV